MCGIAGFLDMSCRRDRGELESVASAMAAALSHRGPDDAGVWADPEGGIALGHRRLSVIDVSSAGRQPMVSRDGRYVAVFNGEIYNFRGLRGQLEARGHVFAGHSDTEVMLAAFSEFGIPGSLGLFNGMFACAVWDRLERRLVIARDRLGEKPLYYGWAGGVFLFGSELKALRACPDFRPGIDLRAVELFLRYQYVPAPHSIYTGIHKLSPGKYCVVGGRAGEAVEESYWSFPEIAARGGRNIFSGTQEEAAGELERLLKDAVAARMISDVPLGVFLSGGIDSSLITALMQATGGKKVRSFTIGFTPAAFDEAGAAAAVASRLGTEHTQLYVDAGDALEVVPRLCEIYDEPFSDSSQIPTVLVSRLTRNHVTVALSGDGGDECFGGYNRYVWASRLWARMRRVPLPLRRAGRRVLERVPERFWDAAFAAVSPLLSPRARIRTPGEKMCKLSGLLDASDASGLYGRLVSCWKEPGIVIPGVLPSREFEGLPPDIRDDFVRGMMYADTLTYLPDDILVKVDRASMSVGLESRCVYLDHRIVEFAWKLPLAAKISGGRGKHILRLLLSRYIPPELTERPKMGFAVPLAGWLRSQLRPWAEELLSEDRLMRDGIFDAAAVRSVWRDFIKGRRDFQHQIWCVLMFQSWKSRWCP